MNVNIRKSYIFINIVNFDCFILDYSIGSFATSACFEAGSTAAVGFAATSSS